MDKPLGNRAGGIAMLVFTGAATWFFGLRPRLEIDLEGRSLRVVNPTSSRRAPLMQVRAAEGGQLLGLRLTSGEVIRAFAVNNTNLTLLLGRRGRTERVADEINDLLARVHSDPVEG